MNVLHADPNNSMNVLHEDPCLDLFSSPSKSTFCVGGLRPSTECFVRLCSAGSESVNKRSLRLVENPPQDMRTEVQGMIDTNAVLVMATTNCPFCIEVILLVIVDGLSF